VNTKYKVDRFVCPFCGSDDTYPDNGRDDTDDYGYAFDNALVYHYRYCDECKTSYKIVYRPHKAVRV
jgi:hypothetical protein